MSQNCSRQPNRIIEYTPTSEYEGKKIYEFLRDNGYSRQNLTDLKFTESGVYLEGNRIKLDHRIQAKETFHVCITETRASQNIPAVELPFDVVYEDEDLVVVNKPSDMPIHPSLNNYDNTLGNAAAYYYKQQGLNFVYRCINRLDRDTTGLVIIAKNIISANMLSKQHQNDEIEKEYTAIVVGEDIDDSGTIDAPIGRKDGSTITRCIDFSNGERAVTHYNVVKRGNGLSLIRLHLETGRTHQIRVHMASIGHPLIGDFLYNPTDTHMSRQALHVGKISFTQPIYKTPITLEVPLPEDMRAAFPVEHLQ